MNYLNDLYQNRLFFFTFMKENYPVFYKSNIFFRDLQYAIKRYYEKKNVILTYAEAEKVANEFVKQLVNENLLIKIDNKSFKMNFSLETEVVE